MEQEQHNSDRDDEESSVYRDYDEELLIGIQRTQAVALTAIIFVSLVGNILVLISLSYCRSRSTSLTAHLTMKQLLSHVCVGDLSYAVLTILPRTINILTFPRFYGGYFVCRLVKFLQLVPVYVCPFLIVACSVERYSNMRRRIRVDRNYDEAISTINRRRISWRESRSFAHVLSFWAWLCAMVLSAPNILAFRYEYLDDEGTIGACVYQVRESYERLWMTFLTGATWFFPSIIVVVLYSALVVRHLAAVCRRRRSASKIRTNDDVEEENDDVRLFKFFSLITLAKFVLWTPFNVTNIVGSYWRTVQISENVSVAVTMASNCACCAPAFAYLIYDYANVRRWLVEKLSKCYSRGRNQIGQTRNGRLSLRARSKSANILISGHRDDDSLPLRQTSQSRRSRRTSFDDKPTIMFRI